MRIAAAGVSGPRRRSVEKRHGNVGSDPGTGCGEADIYPVSGVADNGKGREQIPYAAPSRRWNAAMRRNGRIKHDIDGVSGRSGYKHSESQQGIDWRHGFNLTNRIEAIRDYRFPGRGKVATVRTSTGINPACAEPAPSSLIQTRCSCIPHVRRRPCARGQERSRGRNPDQASRD